ncbi:MAG: hypothetical protein JNL38_18115, partial [Myxococcales bacterium]|nr:hypothetical protein [Myxococcales bacterium]
PAARLDLAAPAARLGLAARIVTRLGLAGSVAAIAAGCGPAAAPEGAASAAPASAPAGSAAAGPTIPNEWPWVAAPGEPFEARADRLRKDPGPHTSNWTPPGKKARYGHAEGLVAAPTPAVTTKISDFFHYKDLAGPKFKTVRVVEKQGDKTDIYFQLPVMRGAIVLWYIARFSQPRRAHDRCNLVEGTFVRGNVDDVHLVLEACEADAGTSVMTCDLNVGLRVPAPESAVDEELRDACADAIKTVRENLKPKADAPPAPPP